MPKEELDKKIKDLEKSHSKLLDIKDELRIISMEYADIRSRIEATDVLVDHVIHQLDMQKRMRRMEMTSIFIVMLLTVLIAILTLISF